MSRLTSVIAPLLARAGLEVRAVSGADGQVRELVITNPRQPGWGKAIIDHQGLLTWDYWGQVADDTGAAGIATVIIAIMATRPIGSERHPQDTRMPGPAQRPEPRS